MADVNQPALRAALRRPDYAGLDDAAAAVKASVAVRTPRAGMATYTTLAAAWGTISAATFRRTLLAIAASGDSLASVAGYVDTLLTGPGIDPGNREVPTLAGQFVVGGVVTQDQVDAVFFLVSYPDGGPCGAADVAAARAANAREDANEAVYQWVRDQVAAWLTAQYPSDADVTLPAATRAGFVAAVTAAQ